MKIIMEHFGETLISGVVFAALVAMVYSLFMDGTAQNIISTFSGGIC